MFFALVSWETVLFLFCKSFKETNDKISQVVSYILKCKSKREREVYSIVFWISWFWCSWIRNINRVWKDEKLDSFEEGKARVNGSRKEKQRKQRRVLEICPNILKESEERVSTLLPLKEVEFKNVMWCQDEERGRYRDQWITWRCSPWPPEPPH